MRYARFSFFVLFPLLAWLISGCTPSLDGGFDVLTPLIDLENAAYVSLQDAVAQSNSTRGSENQNQFWEQTNGAFMEWKRSIDDLADQVPKMQADWNAATAQERADNQARFNDAKSRLTQILTRSVNLSIVIEPWTRYLMTKSKTQWQQSASALTMATNAFFSASLSVPAWNVAFVEDGNPVDNSRIGFRRWSMAAPHSICSGSGALTVCPIADKSVIALRTLHISGLPSFLHKETQSGSIDLGWTNTIEHAIWLERQPGKSGYLEYNETVALHVQDLGYIYYDTHTFGVNLSSTSTPKYEWQIVPQWNEMSGQWIDSRRDFGIQNMRRPGFFGDCFMTVGPDLGWIANVDDVVMNDYACQ